MKLNKRILAVTMAFSILFTSIGITFARDYAESGYQSETEQTEIESELPSEMDTQQTVTETLSEEESLPDVVPDEFFEEPGLPAETGNEESEQPAELENEETEQPVEQETEEPELPAETEDEEPELPAEPEYEEQNTAQANVAAEWTNTAFSGSVPDISDDITVIAADGTEVAEAVVSMSENSYTVTGLTGGQEYALICVPDAGDGYTVAVSQISLIYNEEEKSYAAEAAYQCSLDTYGFQVNIDFIDGASVPEEFTVYLTLNGTEQKINIQNQGDGIFAYNGLYKVDGDYTLHLPEIEDYISKNGYVFTVNAQTANLLQVVYEPVPYTAEFTVYWSDNGNRNGHRTLKPMEDLVTLTGKNGSVYDNITILPEKQSSSEIDGYEKYTYKITGLHGKIGDSLTLSWKSDALMDYNSLSAAGSLSVIGDFAPLTLIREGASSHYTASQVYVMVLPEYKVSLNVSGLGEGQEAEGRIQEFINGIRITQTDLMEEKESPFTEYSCSYEDGVVWIHGLYSRTLSQANGAYECLPAYYTVTWPEQVDGFDLTDGSDTELVVCSQMVSLYSLRSVDSFSADVDYGAPSFETVVSENPVKKTKDVIWYDTKNSYSHGGELSLETTVTINGETFTIPLPDKNSDNTVWDSDKKAYVYSFKNKWTPEQFKYTFKIEPNEEGHPTDAEIQEWIDGLTLEIRDNGDNELNRQFVATIADKLSVERTQFHETDKEYISYDVSVGEIQVTGVSYDPEKNTADPSIKEYRIGSANIDGKECTVLYPMVHVDFSLSILTGDDNVLTDASLSGDFEKITGEMLHLQIKENNEIRDQILKDVTGKNHLEKRLGLIEELNGDDVFVSGTFSSDGKYTFLLPLYNEKKIQIEYAMNVRDEENDSTPDDKVISVGKDEDYWYRVEYNNKNSAGHGTDLDRAYQNGQLILIRTGVEGFTFHKYWQDDGSAETVAARPDATFELWRYADRTGADYASSANVMIPQADENGDVLTGTNGKPVLIKTQSIPKDSNEIDIEIPEGLDKFDAEGYPYIYFIRETIPGDSGYQKFFGKLDSEGKVIPGTDILDNPYEKDAEGKYESRNADDTGVYNNGNITNRKTGYTTQKVTKKWVAAYYQDRLDEVEVTMKLYRKLEGYPDSEAEEHAVFVMDSFDAYNTSLTVGGSYPLYDPEGNKYVYWWEETGVVQKKNGAVVSVSDVPEGLEGISSGSSLSAKYGDVKQYYLPMNAETMEDDSYSPDSREFFEVTSEIVDGVVVFTNTLKGNTEYWIRKTWDSTLTSVDVSFPLLQMNANGESIQWEEIFTLETEDYLTSTYDSGWHKGYVDLPKYDANGNLYTYIARENSIEDVLAIYHYGKDVDGADEPKDNEIEAQSVEVHNGPVGESIVNLRKVWLDDSAGTDRTDVQVQIDALVTREDENGDTVEETVVLYGPSGLYSTDYVALTKATDWIESKTVSLYRANGKYVTVQPAEEDAENILVTYRMTEVSLGVKGETQNAVDTVNTTQAGYSTVTYGATKYVVFYSNGDGTINPDGAVEADGDGYYTVSNLRIGTTKLGITKIWKDDGTVIREDYGAKVQVKCDTDDSRLKSEKNGTGEESTDLGYAKVHPAVHENSWTPVNGGSMDNGEDKKHVDLIQSLPTEMSSTDAEQVHHTTFLYYYDLPLYDETGKILEYSVEELEGLTDEEGGHYTSVSSPLTYDQASNASQYIGLQTITNTFTNTQPVVFNLLWLDDYREGIGQRPDMYLTLYYAKYEYNADGSVKTDEEGNPIYTVERHSYREYNWSDAKKISEDYWQYTFYGLPKYDANGREISYYATVASHVAEEKIDYLMPQYSIGEVPTCALFEQAGVNQSNVNANTLEVTHNIGYTDPEEENPGAEDELIRAIDNGAVLKSDNTFVIQLRSNVLVQGRKVWEQVPVGFPVSDLPLLSFNLKREATAEELSEDTLSIFTPEEESGKHYITLAAILDYRSPSTDYTFDMNYMGILTKDSADRFVVLSKDTDVTYKGTQMKALDAWMDMAGISEADKEEAGELYGQPLPKYNNFGTMYEYKVIESLVKPDNEGFEENQEKGVEVKLQYSLNEYKIVNTIDMGKRPINVSKSWFRFNSSNVFVDTDNAVYPDLEFVLYRFVRVDNENFQDSQSNPSDLNPGAEYTEPELLKTVHLTGAQVKQIVRGEADSSVYAAFGEMEVYAPNGNPYIYVVAEKKIDGFNTEVNPEITVTNAVQMPNGESNVAKWPSFAGDYWYSVPFKLTKAAGVDTSSAAGVEMNNVYTAMEQTAVDFVKQWDDYSNQLNTRPASLCLELSRSFTYLDKDGQIQKRSEKIAEITIHNSDRSNVAVEWENGFKPDDALGTVYKNLTSAYKMNRIEVSEANLTGTKNQWKLTVTNLDEFAPNGSAYRYEWKEKTTPEGYTSVVTGNGIKNVLSTGLRVFKRWIAWEGSDALNEEIVYPEVTVRLLVSDGTKDENGHLVWYQASDYDNGIIRTALGSDYKFDITLNYPHWYYRYDNLPTGNDGKALTYKVVEIKIGDESVEIKDNPGWEDVEVNTGNTSEIHNKLKTTKFKVTKKWIDDDNVFDTRYLENGEWVVSYHLYRSRDKVLESTTDEQLMTRDESGNPVPYVLTVRGGDKSSNEAYAEITGLPTHSPKGDEYTYYAVELNPDGSEITGNRYYGGYGVSSVHGGSAAGGFTSVYTNDLYITNLEVTKEWLEDVNYPDVRPGNEGEFPYNPDMLKLTLKQFGYGNDVNGKNLNTEYAGSEGAKDANYKWKLVTGNDNKWIIVFSGLPKYAPDGSEYTYKVEEEQVPGYQPPTYDENVTAGTEGNLAYEVNNKITKFRMEKIGKDFAGAETETALKNVTLVFEGVKDEAAGTDTRGYKLVWSSRKSGETFYEAYTVTKNGQPWSGGSTESNPGRKVDIYGLPEGTYKISDETVVPDGYYPIAQNSNIQFVLKTNADNSQDLSVTANASDKDSSDGLPELEVYNFKTTLKINKQGKTISADGVVTDNSSNIEIPDGWKFSISGIFADSNGNRVTRYYTAENAAASDLWIGDLLVSHDGDHNNLTEDAADGSVTYEYVLKEEEHPDGYTKSDDEVRFTVNAQNKVVILSGGESAAAGTFDNLTFKDAPFKLLVEKYSTENGNAPLANAEFKLYKINNNDGTMSEVSLTDGTNAVTIKTDSNGQILIPSYLTNPKLKADNITKYMLVETKAPAGYIREEVAAPSGYVLPDDIKVSEGVTYPWIIFQFTTDGTMTEVSRCAIGTPSTASVSSVNNVASFKDDPIKLTLHKHDNGDVFTPASGTELDVKGITFAVKDSTGAELGTVTTDGNGEIAFTRILKNGEVVFPIGGDTYTLQEIPVNGYHKIGNITFKVETNGEISGITYASGEDFAASTPDGGRENTFFELGNDRVPGKVTLKKTSDFGKLSEVAFELFYKNRNNEWVEVYDTDLKTGKSYFLNWTVTGGITGYSAPVDAVSGEVTIENLPWAEYRLVEIAPKDGFLWNDTPVEFKIGRTGDNQYAVDLTGNKAKELKNDDFTVYFYKYAAAESREGGITFDTSKKLGGAEFELTYKAPGASNYAPYHPERKYTSSTENSDKGRIAIDSVVGTTGNYQVVLTASENDANATRYRLTETKAPEGYILPDARPYVEFWIDQKGTVHYSDNSDFAADNTFGDLPIKLTLYKYDGGDEYAEETAYLKADAKFTITEKETDREGIVTTDENGVLYLGIDYGYELIGGNEYTLTEEQVPGFEKLDSFSFKVEENGTISGLTKTTEHGSIAENGSTGIKVVNERKHGSVVLRKVDYDFRDHLLNGAEFELHRKVEAADWIDSLVNFAAGNTYEVIWTTADGALNADLDITAAFVDGRLVLNNLPWGTYYFVETKAPAGYELPQNEADRRSEEFTINEEDDKAAVSMQEAVTVYNQAAEYEFFKYARTANGGAGTALAGAEFKLHLKDSETAIQTYTVSDKTGETGKFTVRSTGLVNNTLTVFIDTSESQEEAAANNRIYRVTETKAPDGYERPNPAPYAEFWVDKQGEFHIIDRSDLLDDAEDNKFLDKPIEITLTKYDGGDGFEDPHRYTESTVNFTIREDVEGAEETTVTMTDGVLTFKPGGQYMLESKKSYVLTEQPVTGYDIVDSFTFYVEEDGTISNLTKTTAGDKIEPDGSEGIRITNERVLGTVEIIKWDKDLQVYLNGAEFKLQREQSADNFVDWLMQLVTGTKYEVVWTTENGNRTASARDMKVSVEEGKLVITDLPWGTYQFVETKAPDGYKLPDDVAERFTKEFTIDASNAEETLRVKALDETDKIHNDTFEFEFYKYASANGITADAETLDNAEFKLHLADNTEDVIRTYISTEGKITVKSAEKVDGVLVPNLIVSGSLAEAMANNALYRITETAAPAGYELPSPAPYVEFWVNETGDFQYVSSSGYVRDDSTFLDKPIEITLTKYDGGDGFEDPHVYTEGTVNFTIREDVEGAEETTVTMTDGVLTFKPGGQYMLESKKSYVLTEQPVTGYDIVDSFTFYVKEDGTISNLTKTTAGDKIELDGSEGIRITNERVLGTVEIIKWDKDLQVYLNGAEFKLQREQSADNFVDWLMQLVTGTKYEVVWTTENGNRTASARDMKVSVEEGKLVITDLPWGTYQFVETKAPDGYKLPDDVAERFTKEFTIDASNAEETLRVKALDGTDKIHNDTFEFEFYKYASANGITADAETLDNAEFKLHLADNTEDVIRTYISTEGKITVKSAEKMDGVLVPNLIVSGSLAEAMANNALYRITETAAPAGYELPSPAPYVEFWVNETGDFQYVSSSGYVQADYTFLNKPIELTLIKYDGGDRGTKAHYTFADPESFDAYEDLGVLAGVSFTLTGSDGSTQTKVTDEDGVLTFGVKDVADFAVVGGVTYTLTEEDMEDRGYEECRPFTFTVKKDGTIEMEESEKPENVTSDEEQLNVVNKRIPGTVTLTKKNEEDLLLNKIVFKLYRLDTPNTVLEKLLNFVTGNTYSLEASFRWDGTAEGDFSVECNPGADGVLVITGLDWGSYKLVEYQADGYILSENESDRTHEFTIGPEDVDANITLDSKLSVTNNTNKVLVHKVEMGDPERKLLKGAVYELYRITKDADGKEKTEQITNTTDTRAPLWIWNSETGIGEASCLPVGDYKLVETKSPYGYVIAEPIIFHMDQFGVVTIDGTACEESNQVPVIHAQDVKTKFTFRKAELYQESCAGNALDTRILPGVTFTAYEDPELKVKIADAVSDKDGIVTFIGLPLKSYIDGAVTPVYIKETATVAGHVLDSTVYQVYVDSVINAKGEVVSNSILMKQGEYLKDNTVINDVYRADFSFTKVSELDRNRVIPGAVYGLYKTGHLGEKLIAEAVSDQNGKVTFRGLLMNETYIVKELAVPDGYYLSANRISFTYKWENGSAKLYMLDNGGGTIVSGNGGWLWPEASTVIAFRKVDPAHKDIAGAQLQLRDLKGNIIPVPDREGKDMPYWISDGKPFVLAGRLNAGGIYELHEIAAPNGYAISDKPVVFRVPSVPVKPGEAKVIEIMMENRLLPENPGDKVPKTGDDTPIAGYLGLLGIGGAGLGLLIGRKKRKKKDN